jgi:polyphosphate kinase 2 (PPK2 family)
VIDGRGFRLADHDPGDTAGLELDKKQAQSLLQQGVQRLGELQEKLYAQDRWAVLLVFQAMDAAPRAAKSSNVISGVDPRASVTRCAFVSAAFSRRSLARLVAVQAVKMDSYVPAPHTLEPVW